MKKLLALLLAAVMVFSIGACGKKDGAADGGSSKDSAKVGSIEDVKVGFIFLHDENSTYDKNFMDAADAVKETLKLSDSQVIFKTNIPEGNECYEAAADLADKGCNIIFADSFGHEPYLLKAAKEFPEVQFCHATGTNAHTEKLANFHNAFASIYQGRYLAGIAAGLKLNEMIANGDFAADDAKIGYVGAYTYAEVISGYTSFFLGARSVCPSATMEVEFTGSWYDETKEKEAATKLISNGCKLISQHADSMGAPTACENAKVPNVSYNGSTQKACPNTFIVSSRINWAPYYEFVINSYVNGEEIPFDWCGGIKEGSVVLTDINDKVAAKGTQEAIDEAKAKLEDGTLNVFDASTFTVKGKKLDSYKADVDSDEKNEKDTEVIEGGYFHESEKRSAPYFDIQIDGIELLNTMF